MNKKELKRYWTDVAKGKIIPKKTKKVAEKSPKQVKIKNTHKRSKKLKAKAGGK